MKNSAFLLAAILAGNAITGYSQTQPAPAAPAAGQTPASTRPPQRGNPEDSEFYEPIPKVVTPGKTFSDAPSDAVILFDGKNMDEWINQRDKGPASWPVSDGAFTVNKATGDIATKKTFTNYQLHIEYRIPSNITGSGQARGNSGIFLAATSGNAGGYEIQVLDGYNNENKTYVNGMVGSVYKESIPLANPSRKAGEWNVYDIVWIAPTFNFEGTLKTPGRVTVFLNGILVQHDYQLLGETAYIGKHEYYRHGPAPIKLQAHGDKSEPISYRNIWLRELK